MPILATGFEAGDPSIYQNMGWKADGEITNRYTHKGKNGCGGQYAMEGSATRILKTPIISNDGRWLHFYLHPGKNVGWTSGYPIYFRSETTIQFSIIILSSGQIQLRRGSFIGTLVATSATNLELNKGYLFTIEMLVANSGGVCNVYIDDDVTSFVSFSGDTKSSNGPFTDNWNSVSFGEVNNAFAYIDDIVINTNAEGRPNETFGHPLKIRSDQSIGLTPSVGTENWRNVLDFDTTNYNSTTTTTTEDLYGIEGNLNLNTTIDFVQVTSFIASKSGFKFQNALKSGTITGYGILMSGAASAYGENITIYELNPDTLAPFTTEEINTLQVGVRSEP